MKFADVGFLIADLSDNNEGAYWEAGFAEGLGKPVFYICCEKDPSDPTKDKKTHFDTNHRHTVRWNADPASFEATAATLKARFGTHFWAMRNRTTTHSMEAKRLSRLHSLSNSLIPVFARVWASTVFTITAQ
jgi:nucleoside 2-deoxyribosyltransferase